MTTKSYCWLADPSDSIYFLVIHIIKLQNSNSLCFVWTLPGAIPKLSTLQISHNRLSTADDLKHLAECHYLRYMMIIVSNNKFFQKIFIVMVCVEGCLIWNHYLRRGLWLIISALTREHVTERTSEIKTSLEV